jgi:hypothetical protein
VRAFKVAKMRDGKGVVSSCISARRWRHSSSGKTKKKKGGDPAERKMFGF